jgi:hypothetical protein
MKKHIILLALLFSCLMGQSYCSSEGVLPLDKELLAIPERAQDRYFVGQLGERWQFPSDHLPIGASMGHFHIAFWNILNKKYLDYIENNAQGLQKSAIMKDNIPFQSESSLTLREFKTVSIILEMLAHPTHPRSLIALQETHEDVLHSLRDLLPPQWVIVTPPDQFKSQDIFIYDRDVFEFIGVEAIKYSPESPKTILALTLKERVTGENYRFIQTHIPGGAENGPEACAKFADEAMRQYDESMTIVLMGDMNQSPYVIEKALSIASSKLGHAFSPYWYLCINYPSHIDTQMRAAWIDHFFIYAPARPEVFDVIRPTQNPKNLSEGMVPMVKLLKLLKHGVGHTF